MRRREFQGARWRAGRVAARLARKSRACRDRHALPGAADDGGPVARIPQGSQLGRAIEADNIHIDTRWAAKPMPPKSAACDGTGRDGARSSWPKAFRRWGRAKRPAACRLCSLSSPIRSTPGLSRAWRGPAATSPGSFIQYELAGKWLELLKEIAPGRNELAVLRSHDTNWHPPIRHHPGRGAVARGDGQPGQSGGRQRDRCRRRGCSRALRVAV